MREVGELVRRVRSPGSGGALVVSDGADGEREVPLTRGTRLGVEVDPQPWCLGFRDLEGNPIQCPDRARLGKGRMCEACRGKDPWRWMHIVHRSQFLDPAMRSVMMAPHWLYVATFAGGMQKVGTAHDQRKRARIDEQGAIAAHWIGWAENGLAIRELEDLVSAELGASLGLGQSVRSSAKTSGLSTSVDLCDLQHHHEATVQRAREVLEALPAQAPDAVRSFAEPWPNPRDPEQLRALILRRYPGHLGSGQHGFVIDQLWGPVALVRLDEDPASHYAVDLSRLVGRKVTFGDFVTAMPERQDSLF